MTTRAHGEGAVFQRADGRWEASMRYQDPRTGERVRKSFYGATKSAAVSKMRAAKKKLDDGDVIGNSKLTVKEWLGTWRDKPLKASDRKETTKRNYAMMSKFYLENSCIGDVRLGWLGDEHIDELLLELKERDLAEATIARAYNVLRLAFADAVRYRHIGKNPLANRRQPKVTRVEAEFLTRDDVKLILARMLEDEQKWLAEHPKTPYNSCYYAVAATIAATGMRRGEALALKWADIDWVASTVRIRGTLSIIDKKLEVTEPKTAQSNRTLALAPQLVDVLARHRDVQDLAREHAGSQWHEDGFVFTTATGTPIHPANLLRAVKTAAAAVDLSPGVTNVTVHMLRHSVATGWLEDGYDMKTVSVLLGHSDAAITGRVYAHSRPETRLAAMTSQAEALGL